MSVEDINHDGRSEVVYAYWSGVVYAVGEYNRTLWSFNAGWYTKISAGDLDHDGRVEVVVASADGHVYCLNGLDGSQIWAYPTAELAVHGNLTLTDVDGDGNLEVVTGEWDSSVSSESPAKVCVIASNGSLVWDHAFTDGTVSYAEDVDNDGRSEVTVYWGRPQLRSKGWLTMLNGNGSIRWEKELSGTAWGSVVFADVNNDGVRETIMCRDNDSALLILNSMTGAETVVPNNYGDLMSCVDGRLFTWKNDTLFAIDCNANKIWEQQAIGFPADDFPYVSSADFDRDGKKDLFVFCDGGVYVFSFDCALIWSDMTPKNAVENCIGDVNGDGRLGLALGSETGVLVYKNAIGSVGGYYVQLNKQMIVAAIVAHMALVAGATVVFVRIRRRRK
jgi:outer membrane protein assembly factor BamB